MDCLKHIAAQDGCQSCRFYDDDSEKFNSCIFSGMPADWSLKKLEKDTIDASSDMRSHINLSVISEVDKDRIDNCYASIDIRYILKKFTELMNKELEDFK